MTKLTDEKKGYFVGCEMKKNLDTKEQQEFWAHVDLMAKKADKYPYKYFESFVFVESEESGVK